MPHVEKRIYWLWCCLGVLLAGCGQAFTTNVGRTPTFALLNLPRPTISPTAILKLIRTATPNAVNAPIAPANSNEAIEPPTCYETAVGSLWCLGRIQNNRDGPLGDTIVQVFLVNQDGVELLSKQVNVARHFIPVGEYAVYSVQFENMPQSMSGPVAFLVHSIINQESPYSARIAVENIKSAVENGIFHVEAQIINHDQSEVTELSIVATIFNNQGQIVGYRQQPLEGLTLSPTAKSTFSLDVVPINPDSNLNGARIEVAVEGRHK